MVGIRVGGTYSGLSVGVIVADAVLLGRGVIDAVVVAVSDEVGNAVGIADSPQAIRKMQIPRKKLTFKNVFIWPTLFTQSWRYCSATMNYRQSASVS